MLTLVDGLPELRHPVQSAAIPASCEPLAVATFIPSRTIVCDVRSVVPCVNGISVARNAPEPLAPVKGLATAAVVPRVGPSAPHGYRTTPQGVKIRIKYCGSPVGAA